MTTLIYVRHGQSTSNLLRVFAGQTDFPLTDLGLRQAEKVAVFLKQNFSLDAIYASDLTRAMQTAAPTAKLYELDIIAMTDLRERAMGIWEGKTNQEINEQYHDLYQAWIRRTGIYPEGAEVPEEYRERAHRAQRKILEESKGKSVAVYTHAGIINVLADDWKKTLPELNTIKVFDNSSITAIEYDDEGIARHVILKNYQDHLGDDVTVLPQGLL